jgi:hypothetical protein
MAIEIFSRPQWPRRRITGQSVTGAQADGPASARHPGLSRLYPSNAGSFSCFMQQWLVGGLAIGGGKNRANGTKQRRENGPQSNKFF